MRGVLSMWNNILGQEQVPHISAHAQYVIETEHARIHEGRGYGVSVIHRGVTNGTVIMHRFAVASGTYPHLRTMDLSVSNAPFFLSVFEASSVSAVGTGITAKNCNRSSANVSSVSLSYAPTVANSGTILDEILIPGGKQSGGIGDGTYQEWILKSDTTYLLGIKNESGTTSDAALRLFWYEMENR